MGHRWTAAVSALDEGKKLLRRLIAAALVRGYALVGLQATEQMFPLIRTLFLAEGEGFYNGSDGLRAI
jgi:hypothetical protein